MQKKYPTSLFIMGFILNLIHHFYLLLPGVVFLIIGIWNKVFLMMGVSLLFVDICISLIEQFIFKRALMTSDNPQVKAFQDATCTKAWSKNVINLVENKVNEAQTQSIVEAPDKQNQ